MEKGSIILLILSLFVLIQISSSLALSEYNLSYDGDGNLIQDLNKYYEYDGFNQLKLVRENNYSGRIISRYSYDADGNRIEKIDFNSDGSNETVYYIGKDFIQIVNSSGVFNETYYHDETDLIAKKDSNGKNYYYHPDQLGSTNIVTNESGDVIENTSYQPYGEIIEGGESRFLFTGKEKDISTGLYYYGARYYDPFFKHFIQPDSIIQYVYDPQSLNRYSYVRNNPYRYIDPSGMFMVGAGGSLSGAFAPFGYGGYYSTSGNFYLIHDDNMDLDNGWSFGGFWTNSPAWAVGTPIYGSASFPFSFSFDINTPEDLQGWSVEGGSSGGILNYVGGGVGYTSEGKSIGTVSVGVGGGWEAHGGASYTEIVQLWNQKDPESSQIQAENIEPSQQSRNPIYNTLPLENENKQNKFSETKNINLNQPNSESYNFDIINTQYKQHNYQSNQYNYQSGQDYHYGGSDFGGF